MRVVDVRADRYVKSVDAADFGRAADVLVVEVDTDEGVSGVGITALFVPRTGEVVDLYARLITRYVAQGFRAIKIRGSASVLTPDESRGCALPSRRDRGMIEVAVEALAFRHEQERCSGVSS